MLSRTARAVAVRPVGVRSWHSTAPASSTPFTVKPVKINEINSIKVERFGSLLENFKLQYEAPIFESFQQVKALKKKVGARKARKIMGKALSPEKVARKLKVQKMKRFEVREKKIERSIHSFLKRDKSKRELFFGRTPFERKRREAIVGRLMHGHFWEPQSPDAEYDADHPPPEIAANPLTNWKWEKTLDDLALAELIAKEMEVEGLEVSWDKFTEESRQRAEKLSDQDDATKMLREHAFGRAMVKDSELVEDRPAILKATRKSKKSKIIKEPIAKVSDENPIAFETVHYPLNTDLYSPYRTRKVTMYVKVAALKLPEAVRARFIELTSHHAPQSHLAPRYDEERDVLKLASRNQRTLRGNRAAVVKVFRKLISEAWKADLNYVAPPISAEVAKLLPHERLDFEEKKLAQEEAAAAANSFSALKEKSGFTIFRIASVELPPADWLQEQRKRAAELLKQLRENPL